MDIQKTIAIFFAVASNILLMYPLAVLGHEIAFTTDVSTNEDLAWATVARSIVDRDNTNNATSAKICRAKLYYVSDLFLEQAAYASELLMRTPLEPKAGGALVVHFAEKIRLNMNDFVWSGEKDHDLAFKADSPQFSDPDYCLVLVETHMADKNINGMAWVCRMCSPTLNVAFVNTLADDSLVFSVIMHELGHLLCAKHDHSGGVMRPTAIGDSQVATLSGTSVASISLAVAQNSGEGGCLQEGTTSNYLRKNHERHYQHEHDVDDGAIYAASFLIFTIIFLSLTLPFCLLY